MPTRYPLTKIVFILVLLMSAILFPLPAHGQGGEPQRREVPPLDVIILVDESETMWNKTDTEGIRVNTVNYFIDLLSSEQSGSRHRLAIIAFGTEPIVIPFAELDTPEAAAAVKAEFEAVHKRIEAHKDLEYTDINQALDEALKLMDQPGSEGQKPAVILISDGQPTKPQVSEKRGQEVVEAYLTDTRALLNRLAEHPYSGNVCPTPQGAPLYMVGMGVDKLAESSTPEFIALYREFWQENAGSTQGYYREAEQLQDMQGIGTYIFSELLCIPATPSLGIRADQVLEYQIHESYYQIFFTISGKENPDLTAKVFRPQADGTVSETPLEKDEAGVTWQGGPDYEVWGITYTEPWAGTWRIMLEGEGRAEFSYVFFPKVSIMLDEPNSGFLPIDKPFNIQARVADENGQVVDIPLKNFQVEIEGQGLREQIDLEKDGDVFITQHDPLSETGEYSLTFSAQLPDGSPIYEHKFVTLVSAPWVEVTDPIRRSSFMPAEPILLQANVHPSGAASFDDIKLIATLLKNDEPLESIELSQGESFNQNGEDILTYSGTFQSPDTDGQYAIQTKLRAILPGGRVFDHTTAPVPLSVVTPPTATPNPSPTPSPSPSPLPTATPTATSTSEPAVVVVPTSTPTPSPMPTLTPTPTPQPWYAALTSSSSPWPWILGLLLLLLLLLLLGVFLYKRRQPVPDKIQLLARLMQSRRDNGEPPYILILGSGAAVSLGSRSLRTIIETIAGGPDLETFHSTLDGFSQVERQIILQEHFAQADISSGYRCLATLAQKGFFNIIFTTNLDPFLENSLDTDDEETADFQVIIAEKQRSTETIALLQSTFPSIKIVKLHGDVQARSFAFTPSEISQFGTQSEEILHHFFNRDLLIIGPGPRDYDLNRALAREGGSIWYIDQDLPVMDSPISQAVGNRSTEMNIIIGEYGAFDKFFEALYRELMH